ncbi:MAG: class I SAM-dependent methyltransferase [Candidatus Gottesmanbacteria bacterium]
MPQQQTSLAHRDYYDNININDFISYYDSFRTPIFKQNWKQISKWRSYGKALDIGSSYGGFLKVAPKGWNVFGLDSSAQIVKLGQAAGLDIAVDLEDALANKREHYDLITMWNVLEHFPNPKKTLINVYNHLNPGGIVGIAVPNRNGIFNKLAYIIYWISGKRITYPLYVLFQVDRAFPHLYHFSLSDIIRLLESTGYKVLYKGSQPIIDIKRLNLRMRIEKKYLFLNVLISPLIFITYFLSWLFRRPDEVIIYAYKAS